MKYSKIASNNTSGVKGVNKATIYGNVYWQARVCKNGKNIFQKYVKYKKCHEDCPPEHLVKELQVAREELQRTASESAVPVRRTN